ncbi:hypothetical protein ACFQHO_51620 [Actinomadura yumaensis]|uniref:hypothetical protein n=1 Tax=Actinomadura yumaensis TaxID=111807 RepID=UPI003617C632
MSVRSILFGSVEDAGDPGGAEPEYFRDLNLDQVAGAVAEAAGSPDVAPYFHRPLHDPAQVVHRQRIFRDLEDPAVLAVAERFTASMARTRTRLDALARRKHPPQADRWFLEIVLDHTAAVEGLGEGLDAAGVASPGLRTLRDDIAALASSAPFNELREGAARLRDRLGEVRYDLLLRGDQVSVAAHDEDGRFDYAERVLARFERFRQQPPRAAPWTVRRCTGWTPSRPACWTSSSSCSPACSPTWPRSARPIGTSSPRTSSAPTASCGSASATRRSSRRCARPACRPAIQRSRPPARSCSPSTSTISRWPPGRPGAPGAW